MPPNRSTRRAKSPRSGKPNLRPAPEVPEFETFEDLLQEAQGDLVPYKLVVSEDETLVIECPTGDDMDDLAEAESNRDKAAMLEAVFGEHADRVDELTRDKPFMVIGKLVERVLTHYGLQGDNLPE